MLSNASSNASLEQDHTKQEDSIKNLESLIQVNKAECVEKFENQIRTPTKYREGTSSYHQYHLVKVAIDILKEMTNFRLLVENKPFALMVVANFFVFIGYFVPFIYIPIRGRELEIQNITIVLSIIGR